MACYGDVVVGGGGVHQLLKTQTSMLCLKSGFIWSEIDSGPVQGSGGLARVTSFGASTTSAIEKLNSRSAAPTTITTDVGTETSVLNIRSAQCSHCAWRGDYRRAYYVQTDEALAEGGCEWTCGTTSSTRAAVFSEDFANVGAAKRFRRSRNDFFFLCDAGNHRHAKTGGGAFEMTSRPHSTNEGLTWLDKTAWSLGNCQGDFWNINLYGTPRAWFPWYLSSVR